MYAPVRRALKKSSVLSSVFYLLVHRTNRTGYLNSVRFFSDAYGAIKFALCELVGARSLHLTGARPFGHLKAPLGLSLLRKRELD
ncbi:hypothetical protein DXA66_11060 [Faecalibacterium sp. OF03-6AC]|nr:hypothetical protein DXA66_11060 [Faecalibacterium sp. OF03-6AC]